MALESTLDGALALTREPVLVAVRRVRAMQWIHSEYGAEHVGLITERERGFQLDGPCTAKARLLPRLSSIMLVSVSLWRG